MAASTAGDRPLYAVSGIAEHGTDEVTATAFDWLAAQHPATTGVHVAAGRDAGRYVVRGDWWYQGTWTFAGVPDGTRIDYRCDNIARRGRWLVPLVLLQYRLSGTLDDARGGGLRALLDHVGRVHDCRTRIVPAS